MEPLSSQAIVDEDNNQDGIVDVNVAAELESQCDNNEPPLTATPVRANNNDNIPQPPAPKKPRKNPTSTGTLASSSKRKLQFTTDDVVGEEDEQPSSLGRNA